MKRLDQHLRALQRNIRAIEATMARYRPNELDSANAYWLGNLKEQAGLKGAGRYTPTFAGYVNERKGA